MSLPGLLLLAAARAALRVVVGALSLAGRVWMAGFALACVAVTCGFAALWLLRRALSLPFARWRRAAPGAGAP